MVTHALLTYTLPQLYAGIAGTLVIALAILAYRNLHAYHKIIFSRRLTGQWAVFANTLLAFLLVLEVTQLVHTYLAPQRPILNFLILLSTAFATALAVATLRLYKKIQL